MRPECEVRASSKVLPSEDPASVRRAVENVLPEAFIEVSGARVSASGGASSLERVRETALSRGTGAAYRSQMRANASASSTWFYPPHFVERGTSCAKPTASSGSTWFCLNKQAAFAGTVALCGGVDESPLGPITVSVGSFDISAVIDWLAPPARPRAG